MKFVRFLAIDYAKYLILWEYFLIWSYIQFLASRPLVHILFKFDSTVVVFCRCARPRFNLAASFLLFLRFAHNLHTLLVFLSEIIFLS